MEKKKETKRFDLMEFGSALGREEMKKLMAGSQGACECSVTPCEYPQYTACCCLDGRKTCVVHNQDGWLQCVGFCEEGDCGYPETCGCFIM